MVRSDEYWENHIVTLTDALIVEILKTTEGCHTPEVTTGATINPIT